MLTYSSNAWVEITWIYQSNSKLDNMPNVLKQW